MLFYRTVQYEQESTVLPVQSRTGLFCTVCRNIIYATLELLLGYFTVSEEFSIRFCKTQMEGFRRSYTQIRSKLATYFSISNNKIILYRICSDLCGCSRIT